MLEIVTAPIIQLNMLFLLQFEELKEVFKMIYFGVII